MPQNCSAECYVDDTKLYMCFPTQDHENTMVNMNNDLIRIGNWYFDNPLLLNPDKTKLMVFGSKQMIAKIPDFRLSLLGKELIPAQSVKELGITFDCNLNFNEHILNITASCMSSLGQISRVKYAFKKELLIMIINDLVFSKLYYCYSVWSNTTDKNICKLQSIQNYAARIIYGRRKYDHVTPILRELRCIPVKSQLYYRDAILAFKCMTEMAPTYLSSQFLRRRNISGKSTRQAQLLNIPLFRSATGQRTFYYRIVKLWNNLCPEIKLRKTIWDFKRKLKRDLLDSFLS